MVQLSFYMRPELGHLARLNLLQAYLNVINKGIIADTKGVRANRAWLPYCEYEFLSFLQQICMPYQGTVGSIRLAAQKAW